MRLLRLIVSLIFLIASPEGFTQSNSSQDSLLVPPDPSTKIPNLVTISDVVVSGNKKTKIFIVMREVSFRKGDQLTETELEREMQLTRQQLMNTSLFVDVTVYISSSVKTGNSNTRAIAIDLKERWYLFPTPYFRLIDRNFNQWWVEQHRSLERVNYGLKFIQNNFTGRNDDVDIWLITGYTQQITLRYNLPFF